MDQKNPDVIDSELKNGVRVIYIKVYSDHPESCLKFILSLGPTEPVITEKGLAHILEHLIVQHVKSKYSSQNIPNKVSGEVAFDKIDITITFLINDIESILKPFGTILKRPTEFITETTFKAEQSAIVEELQGISKSDSMVLEILMFRELLPKDHPLSAGDPGGIAETVRTTTFRELEQFYKKTVKPSSTQLIISTAEGNWVDIIMAAERSLSDFFERDQ